jgi:streptogramin lyase
MVLSQPLNGTIPSDIVYDRGRNRVWFLAGDNLTYYDPSSNTTTIEHTFSGDTNAQYMAIDHNGKLWISLLIYNNYFLKSDKIAEYDPSNKQLNLYDPQTPLTGLAGVAVAPDNSVWFAEPSGTKIGHILCTQTSCSVSEFTAPSEIHIIYLVQLTVGADGTVWFTDHGAGEFGSFNPSNYEWRVFPIGYCAESYNPDCGVGLPNAISFDSNGRLWFSEHVAGRVAEFDPASQVLTEFVVPTTTPPYVWWMQPGPGNLVWFTAYSLGKIGYVNASALVPISVSAPGIVDLVQGQTVIVTASVLSPQSSVSLGVTANGNDAEFGVPASLYGNWTGNQIDPSSSPVGSNLTVTAVWNLSPGDRYISLTAYNGSLQVSTFVKIHVIAHYYLATSFAPFLGLGSVAAILAGSSILYVRGGLRKKKTFDGEATSRFEHGTMRRGMLP